MYGKTDVMNEKCSQTFPRKLKQNFYIFVPVIRAKSENQMTVKALTFYKKHFFREGMATQPEPSKAPLHLFSGTCFLTNYIY